MNAPLPPAPQTQPDPSAEKIAAGSYAAYSEYNKTLRTWLVAFGIGGPALFLVNDTVAKRLVTAGTLKTVAALFLIGTAVQVLSALLNKASNWYVYQAYAPGGVQGSLKHRCCEWLTSHFWIDITLDLLSFSAFGYAAWLLFTVFAAG